MNHSMSVSQKRSSNKPNIHATTKPTSSGKPTTTTTTTATTGKKNPGSKTKSSQPTTTNAASSASTSKNTSNNNMMLLSSSSQNPNNNPNTNSINPTPPSNANNTYTSGSNGSVLRRIRAPSPNDVLSGRGGGINAHEGNVQFREWVRVRKNEYNLAPTKAEKTRIAQQVIDLVRARSPPGRFLQKDPTGGMGGGWWIELDEERIMAKTSQALREGAPQIRAAHQHSLGSSVTTTTSGRQRKSSRSKAPSARVRTSPPVTSSGSPVTTTPLNRSSLSPTEMAASTKRPFGSLTTSVQRRAIQQLQANVVEAQTHATAEATTNALDQEHEHHLELLHEQILSHHQTAVPLATTGRSSAANVVENTSTVEPATKRVRVEYNGHALRPTDESPPLMAQDASDLPPILDLAAADLPPLSPLPAPRRRSMEDRSNSLALTELHASEHGPDHDDWEFVNPFENESFLLDPQLMNHPPPSPAATATATASGHAPNGPHKELGGRRDSSGSEGGSAQSAPSLPPRVGIFHRETSAGSDMGGLGALLENLHGNNNNHENNPNHQNNHHNHLRVRSLTHNSNTPAKSSSSSNNNGSRYDLPLGDDDSYFDRLLLETDVPYYGCNTQSAEEATVPAVISPAQ